VTGREPSAGEDRPSILFVNQHYWPDVASTGQHLTDLAEYLAECGYAVEVLTGRGHYVAGTLRAPAAETRNGVRIRRVRATSFGRGSHLGRLVDYATFYLRVLGAVVFGRGYDGVVVLTTPPLLAVIGRLARLLRGQRYAVWSMDLHPDAEVASGMLDPRGLVARLLEALHRFGLRGADFVVDLGPYMKRRLVEKGVPIARCHTVHVWSRAEEIEPMEPEDNPILDELGLRGRFVVMYSGNAGVVHDFEGILEAVRMLDGDPRIHFLFVGGGPRRKEIEAFAARHALGNLTYREYFPREQLRFSLSVGDAHLISLRAPFVGISVPGKLYGIMASGRPALFVGPERSESAETIRAANAGTVIDPAAGDAAYRIMEQLRAWADAPHEARALGDRGRAAFLVRYEREPNCAEFARTIASAWRGPSIVGKRTHRRRPRVRELFEVGR
jgi:colanic acid biosynthesis glycosyl transferase WcaI